MRYLSVLILFGIMACTKKAPEKTFTDYFQPISPGDTVIFQARIDPDDPLPGDTLPLAVLKTYVSQAILDDIAYVADTATSLFFTRGKFTLDDHTELLWMEAQNSWFNHHSLFMWDKKANKVSGQLTVAEWYGGESGQILISAYLMPGKTPVVVVRQTERTTRISDAGGKDEIQESRSEQAALWQISGGKFIQRPVYDEARLMRDFPGQPLDMSIESEE